MKESGNLYYAVLEIEYCHPLHTPQWALVGMAFAPQIGTAHTVMDCKCSLQPQQKGCTLRLRKQLYWEIQNTHVRYLSGRKIVFKNTSLNVRVCSKVEFVCTVRQYLRDHPTGIIFEFKVSLWGFFFSPTKRTLGCIINYLLR